jgi:hypothetical protein
VITYTQTSMYIGIVLYVLIVFLLHWESLKLILVDEPLPEGVLSQYPDKPEHRYTRGTRESALCQNSQNSGRASTLDRTRAWKSPSNPNRFRQSFRAQATLRTPDKSGSPPALRTSHLSLLYKNELGSTMGGLNLTLFTLSAGGTMVFIGGVGQCCSQRLGAWGPLIRPTDHATWPSGQVSSLYHLWALDTLSTTSDGHVDKTVFGDAPTHGRPTKVMWPAGYTLAWFSLCLVPRHFLVSYCLWLCLILT